MQTPVIALTGYLGAGKTTLLNHVLSQPGARVGVVVNDFGDINVDAALITGQVDEPASISGGCLCCLVDDDSLDRALDTLTHPRLGVDVVIVEASGIAEPGALARLIRFSGAERVRPGGVVDVIDAVEHFNTVDTGGAAPARFAAASLVVINKCDLVPEDERGERLDRLEARVREVNPTVPVVRSSSGRIDPRLLFDAASTVDPPDQLPFAAVHRSEHPSGGHDHAAAASATSAGPVDPARVLDLLEDPPANAYRIKGRVVVRSGGRARGYAVNLVGRSVHIASIPATGTVSELVAVGLDLPVDDARSRLEWALEPCERPTSPGLRRLQRYRRLSM